LPEVKGIYFDGNLFDGSEFKRIAEMPTKEELLAKFAALLSSPMTKLARTLQAPMADVGYALSNLKEQKSN
jgi:large subunit ribosomal protein L10